MNKDKTDRECDKSIQKVIKEVKKQNERLKGIYY